MPLTILAWLAAAAAQIAAQTPPAVPTAPPPAAAPKVATPAYYAADSLKRDCAAADRIEICFAFVAAVRDTSRAYQEWNHARDFCLPAAVTMGELRDATLHYIELHPRNGDALAASVVVLAMKDAYPCSGITTAIPEPAPAPAPTKPPGATPRRPR